MFRHRLPILVLCGLGLVAAGAAPAAAQQCQSVAPPESSNGNGKNMEADNEKNAANDPVIVMIANGKAHAIENTVQNDNLDVIATKVQTNHHQGVPNVTVAVLIRGTRHELRIVHLIPLENHTIEDNDSVQSRNANLLPMSRHNRLQGHLNRNRINPLPGNSRTIRHQCLINQL